MTSQKRVASVDVLRGVCLLGILVMNIQSFAMPHAAYLNPTLFGSLAGADGVAWALGRLLFDFKFLSLFSMLFGASLILAGEETRPLRRLLWLVVFGLVHAYGVWYGDILFTYGVVGIVVLGARRWSPRRQLAVGVTLLVVSTVLVALVALFFDALPGSFAESIAKHLDARSIAAEVTAYRSGWLAQTPLRAALSFEGQTSGLLLETGWRAAGCMLVGMAATRRRVFDGSVPVWPWVPLGLASGLAITGAGMVLAWTQDFRVKPWLFAQALHELGAIPLSMAIGLSVVALANRYAGTAVVESVGRLGRVAFTAYLMHSLVGTWVFGGQGLGLFGTWSRTTLLVVPLAVWIVQIGLAWLWTARYRVGPVEALWRGLARGEFSVGRVTATPSSPPAFARMPEP